MKYFLRATNFTTFLLLSTITVGNSTTAHVHDTRRSIEQMYGFLNDMAFFESSNRPHISKGQYWGKYQLGTLARKDVKYTASKKEFLSDELTQDLYMIAYLQVNRRYINRLIKEYEGRIINGIRITKPGLLAGAHLVGHAKVKQFLQSNGKVVPKDGNGTPITKYIAHFAKFDDGFTVHVDVDKFIGFTKENS
jgi:hypothetical protein